MISIIYMEFNVMYFLVDAQLKLSIWAWEKEELKINLYSK